MAQNLPNVFEMGIGDRKIEKKNRCHSENKNVNDFVITLVVVRFFYLRKTEFKAFTFHLPHVSQCVCVCLWMWCCSCYSSSLITYIVADSFVTASKAFLYFHEFITSRRLIHGFHVYIRMWFRKSSKMLCAVLNLSPIMQYVSISLVGHVVCSPLNCVLLPKSCTIINDASMKIIIITAIYLFGIWRILVFNIFLFSPADMPSGGKKQMRKRKKSMGLFSAETVAAAMAATTITTKEKM